MTSGAVPDIPLWKGIWPGKYDIIRTPKVAGKKLWESGPKDANSLAPKCSLVSPNSQKAQQHPPVKGAPNTQIWSRGPVHFSILNALAENQFVFTPLSGEHKN